MSAPLCHKYVLMESVSTHLEAFTAYVILDTFTKNFHISALVISFHLDEVEQKFVLPYINIIILSNVDENECLRIPGPCQGNSICVNIVGGFECQCPRGYKLGMQMNDCTGQEIYTTYLITYIVGVP